MKNTVYKSNIETKDSFNNKDYPIKMTLSLNTLESDQ